MTASVLFFGPSMSLRVAAAAAATTGIAHTTPFGLVVAASVSCLYSGSTTAL